MFIYLFNAYYKDGTELENFDDFKNKLYNVVTRSKYMFHHVFRKGDLLFMDQLTTSHRRSAVKMQIEPYGEQRLTIQMQLLTTHR